MRHLGLAARLAAEDFYKACPASWTAIGADGALKPAQLICPADTERQAAESWQAFNEETNSSYKLHTDKNLNGTHPGVVLAECRLHGNTLLGDGSVELGHPVIASSTQSD